MKKDSLTNYPFSWSIRFTFLVLIILLSLVSCPKLYAVEADKAAHFGTSFALQMFMYGFFKKALHLNDDEKWKAHLLAAPLVLGLGALKEADDNYNGGRFDGGDMLANTAGVGFAIGTVLMFDF